MKIYFEGSMDEVEKVFDCNITEIKYKIKGLGESSGNCTLFQVMDVERVDRLDLDEGLKENGFSIKLPEKKYRVTMEPRK